MQMSNGSRPGTEAQKIRRLQRRSEKNLVRVSAMSHQVKENSIKQLAAPAIVNLLFTEISTAEAPLIGPSHAES